MTEILAPRQHEKYDRLIATAKKQPALVDGRCASL